MNQGTIYPHVTFNAQGKPCIDGTRHRAIDIVADHVAHRYSAAQIVEHYPDLTPAQFHAAESSSKIPSDSLERTNL